MQTIKEIKISTDQALTKYELLADLFFYPESEHYAQKIKETYEYLLNTVPEAAEAMNPFMNFLATASLREMQELFLRSFDVQAITTLDIGFILFGEDYKRGQLLVHLNREHREAGNICHTELSDHLPNVIRLLPKMKDENMRNEIALKLLLPAVVKMIDEFDVKKIEKKDKVYKKNQKTIIDYSVQYRTVYQTLLQSLFIVLKNDFGYIPVPTGVKAEAATEDISLSACSTCTSHGPISGDFSSNIETEMNIEKY